MQEKEVKTKVADSVLDNSVKFSIETGLLFPKRVKLSVRPLRLGTLIYISKEQENVSEVELSKDVLPAIAKLSANIKPATKIVAYSILNSRVKIKLFSGIFSRWLAWRISPKELNSLLALSLKQSEVTDFFGSTVLLKGMGLLEQKKSKAVTSRETKQSGGQ